LDYFRRVYVKYNDEYAILNMGWRGVWNPNTWWNLFR
jgi:hypothetical protein